MRATRITFFAGATLSAAALWLGASKSEAGPLGKFVHHINEGYEENNRWIYPYVYADRAAVRAPFVVMVQKGWQEQNLLGTHNYKPGTTQVTDAGMMKIRWIVTQAPQGFRTVWVERGDTPQETADRMAAVRAAAQRFVVGGEQVDVQESNLASHGWPAEYIVRINDMFQSSTPPPRLPADNGGVLDGASSGGSQ